MKLQRLEISNFGPFAEDQVLDLEEFNDEAVLIIGENQDEPGMSSNGSGKSSIFHALSWALLGKYPSKSPADSVVREDTKQCIVRLSLISSTGDLFEITRSRRRKTELSWSLNSQTQEFNTPTQSNAELCKKLGFHPKTAYTDLINSAYFSVEAMAAFTSRSGGSEDRMALISRFLGIDILDIARDLAKDQRSGTVGTVKALEENIRSLTVQLKEDNFEEASAKREQILQNILELNQHQDVLKAEQKRAFVRDDAYNKLKLIIAKLEGLDQSYDETRESLSRIEKTETDGLGGLLETFETMQSELEGAEYTQSSEIQEHLDDLLDTFGTIRTKTAQNTSISEVTRESLARLRAQIIEAQKCPECKTKLQVIKGHIHRLDLSQLREKIVGLQTEIQASEEINANLIEQATKLRAIREELKDHHSLMLTLEKKFTEKRTLQSEIESSTQRIEVAQASLKELDKHREFERANLTKKQRAREAELEDFDDVQETSILADKIQVVLDEISFQKDELQELVVEIARHQEREKQLADSEKQLASVEHQFKTADFWADGFHTLRRWRVDRFLPEFELEMNRLLSEMGTSIRVTLDTLRKKRRVKKGEDPLREGFNIEVNDAQGRVRDLGSYSVGESSRIGLTAGFALRELTMRRGTNRLQFVLIDEVVDSMDSAGSDYFFKLMSQISGLKLVISHDDDFASKFTRVIKVIKSNGISRIVEAV